MTDARIAVLAALAASPDLSQQELAHRLGVSERTARRYLRPLIEAGTVLVTPDGPVRRYRLADHAHPASEALAPELPSFTEGEIEALSVAALAARDLLAPTPLVEALEGAAQKLRRAWLSDVFTFELEGEEALWSFDGAAGGQAPATEPVLFRALLEAVRNQNPVRADYHTASRDALTLGRRLAPLGFLVRSGTWLVAAVDLDAAPAEGGQQPVKDFALAGFRRVERLEAEVVLRPEDFDLALHARDRFGALDGEVALVRLLVEPEAVPAFRRKLYDATQQIEEVDAGGWALVSFEVGGLEAVKSWCLGWGAKVRVLEPSWLAAEVAAAHRAAAARYEEP